MFNAFTNTTCGVCAASLLATAGFSSGAVLILDEFSGTSGGVPAGWTDFGMDTNPLSTVVESGGNVTLTDTRSNGGPQFLMSDAVEASVSDLLLTIDISSSTSFFDPGSGYQSVPQAFIMLGSAGRHLLMIQFDTATRRFSTMVGVNGPPWVSYEMPAGEHVSYSGGAIRFQLAADSDSFRILSGDFDSGDILFSAAGKDGFDSLDDLGTNLSVIIGTESAGSAYNGTLAEISYDRVELSGTLIPEPGGLMLCLAGCGMIAATRRRRRDCPRS